MPEKKKRAPKTKAAIAGGMVLLWSSVIFSYLRQPEVSPQIVYGMSVETEIETETEQLYSDDDLYLLSHLIAGEVNDCDWEMKIAVGSVVLNRVADPRFPSDLYGVIYQSGQYSCTWDGNFNKEPNEDTIEAAKYLLVNGSQLPSDVIFQAEFVQGRGIYKSLLAPNGVTEYFCIG